MLDSPGNGRFDPNKYGRPTVSSTPRPYIRLREPNIYGVEPHSSRTTNEVREFATAAGDCGVHAADVGWGDKKSVGVSEETDRSASGGPAPPVPNSTPTGQLVRHGQEGNHTDLAGGVDIELNALARCKRDSSSSPGSAEKLSENTNFRPARTANTGFCSIEKRPESITEIPIEKPITKDTQPVTRPAEKSTSQEIRHVVSLPVNRRNLHVRGVLISNGLSLPVALPPYLAAKERAMYPTFRPVEMVNGVRKLPPHLAAIKNAVRVGSTVDEPSNSVAVDSNLPSIQGAANGNSNAEKDFKADGTAPKLPPHFVENGGHIEKVDKKTNPDFKRPPHLAVNYGALPVENSPVQTVSDESIHAHKTASNLSTQGINGAPVESGLDVVKPVQNDVFSGPAIRTSVLKNSYGGPALSAFNPNAYGGSSRPTFKPSAYGGPSRQWAMQ